MTEAGSAVPNERAKPIGRLAPSPTGAQHVGNARTYLLAWLSIRSRGGTVVLRMEDIDSPRIKANADRQAIEDLAWLGLDWDEGPDIGGRYAPYQQTQRLALYESVLEELRQRQRVYPCTCSRGDIAAAASAPHGESGEPVYPGTCRRRRAEEAASLDLRYAWRFRNDATSSRFVDRVAGECTADPKMLDDFVVWKSNQTPAYQLAVVVDDHAMGIDEVVRGADLIGSTHRQLRVYREFGWSPPRFVHVPLVVGPDGRRLAKRHGDTRLCQLRAAGVSVEDLIGLLAWSCGLRPTTQPITASELLAEFEWGRIHDTPFVLTPDHLRGIGYRG